MCRSVLPGAPAVIVERTDQPFAMASTTRPRESDW
jgi:hypothetical protein